MDKEYRSLELICCTVLTGLTVMFATTYIVFGSV